MAWTTTPWTLPSILALCVNIGFTYVKVNDKVRNRVYILLEKALPKLFPESAKADCTEERKRELFDVLDTFLGEKLVGLRYQPLFGYFVEKMKDTAFRVVSDNYVTDDAGVGIVHQAPAFGEDDNRVCLAHGIILKGSEIPCPVDANGRFTPEVSDFKGVYVKDADTDICAHLKGSGRLILKETYTHSYPFCWRSDTPLIYKAVPSWFVSVESIKERLVANNTLTYWVPAVIQEKRFHNWLVNAKDWAISRNRFWGTPIPLWASEDMEEVVAVGSVQELFELSGVRVTDLHKEFVDQIAIPSKMGKGMLRRVDEVFDCWFESGSMPYAQMHYPFENKERFENGFPADFIAEGLDQTRGWFYTLMVLSTALFDKPAFKNLIVNGLVLAQDGKKMSKRLQNYPDPTIVLENYGADALRLYLINSPVVRADELKFREDGVSDVLRGVLIPWFNAFRFFVQCVERWESEVDESGNKGTRKFAPSTEMAKSSTNDVDIWILATAMGLVKFVHQEMQAYRLYTVVPKLVSFIEDLTNWYVRLNRDRLKGSNGEEESLLGLNVLYEILMTLTTLMAPFTPFFTEYLYQHLRKWHPLCGNTDSSIPVDVVGKSASVHFVMLPEVDESRLNPLAESRFSALQQVVQLARVGRDRKSIRQSLPLKNILVVCSSQEVFDGLNYLQSYVQSEVNTWTVTLSTNYQQYCALKVQPNWKELGKSLGKDMKVVAAAIGALTNEQIVAFMESGVMSVHGHELTRENIVVKREFIGDKKRYEAVVNEDGSLLVALDTTCDEEVFEELRAKCLAASIQKLRKSTGLVVQDVVEVFYTEGEGASGANSVAKALCVHASSTVKRIRTFPLPESLKPKYAIKLGQETVKDSDLSKSEVTLTLTAPSVSVSENNLLALSEGDESVAALLAMYLQTVKYSRLVSRESFAVRVMGRDVVCLKNVHYFSSVIDLLRGDTALQAKYPLIPLIDA